MSDLIDAIIKTRETAADIFSKSLTGIEGKSEAEIRDKALSETKNFKELFETGWYDPPPGGVGVLFAQHPFQRLKYDSLRKPLYWPSEEIKFEKETVAMIYSSVVDRRTGMLGDIGFTIYTGKNKKIKYHIKKAYSAILNIAEYAEVGMKLSDLCFFAENSFKNKFKRTKWVTMSSDLNQSINIGHSVPGSFGDKLTFGNTIKEVREIIRTKRIHVIDIENFEIPQTSAFTIESRLENFNDPDMPSVYFHFIVCFKNGEKTILENFSQIFSVVGMDYIDMK